MLKIKGTKCILFSLLISCIPIPILFTYIHFYSSANEISEIDVIISSLMFALFATILVVGAFTTYIINREYTSDMLKSILPIPVSKMKLFLSKLVFIFLWTIAIDVMIYLSYVVTCSIILPVGLNSTLALIALKGFAVLSLLQFMLVSPIVTLCYAQRKGYLFSLGLTAFILIGSFLFMMAPTEIQIQYPWYYVGIISMPHFFQKISSTFPPNWYFYSTIAVCGIGVLGYMTAYIIFKRQDC